MTASREFAIGELFDIRYGDGKLTKAYLRSHKGEYPVFGASIDPSKAIGAISTYNYDCDALSFVRIGYAGNVALRMGKFSVTCNVLVLLPKADIAQHIHLPYFVPVISSALRRLAEGRFKPDGSHDYTQITQRRAVTATINVPIDVEGFPDLHAQVAIASRQEQVLDVKRQLGSIISRLDNFSFEVPHDGCVLNEVPLGDLFEVQRGNSKHTKVFARSNAGPYPLYTAATRNVRPDCINLFTHDVEGLHYTTEGAHAGTVFHRPAHRFSMSGHAGILIAKNDLVQYRYAFHEVARVFRQQGFRWASNTPSADKIKKLPLRFPVTQDGILDVPAQRRIAEKMDRLVRERDGIIGAVQTLIECDVTFA